MIVNYCQIFNFLKVKNTLGFPLVCNCWGRVLCPEEYNFFFPIRNDLEFLQQMFICAKYLQSDALYQVIAAGIASWFKLRTTAEVFELKMNNVSNES